MFLESTDIIQWCYAFGFLGTYQPLPYRRFRRTVTWRTPLYIFQEYVAPNPILVENWQIVDQEWVTNLSKLTLTYDNITFPICILLQGRLPRHGLRLQRLRKGARMRYWWRRRLLPPAPALCLRFLFLPLLLRHRILPWVQLFQNGEMTWQNKKLKRPFFVSGGKLRQRSVLFVPSQSMCKQSFSSARHESRSV